MKGMEYIYAALLLHSSGKEITEEGISAVMEAAGIEADRGRIKGLINALNGVNIDEAISQAQPAFAPAPAPAVPQAAAAAAAPAAAAAEAPPGEKEKKVKEEKEEEEEEKAEETGMEGLASLFG